MKRVVIRRRKWCRGESSIGDGSALRTKTGQSCCLGFVARACGVKTPTGTSTFSRLDPSEYDKLPKKLAPTPLPAWNNTWLNSSLHNALVSVNDGDELTGKSREKEIRRLLKQANILAVFKD